MNILKYKLKRKTEDGRSMIEMLGVLAIIGVLSVGGLIGYSKAMERHRVNETINQINYVVQNTRDLFRMQPNLYGSMSSEQKYMYKTDYENRQLADKAQLFPSVIVKDNYKNLFGGYIYFYASGRYTKNDGKAFILGLTRIPQEACIEIITRDWQSALGLVAVRAFGSAGASGGSTILQAYTGKCTTSLSEGTALICGKDMPVSIEQAVTACDMEKENNIFMKFY